MQKYEAIITPVGYDSTGLGIVTHEAYDILKGIKPRRVYSSLGDFTSEVEVGGLLGKVQPVLSKLSGSKVEWVPEGIDPSELSQHSEALFPLEDPENSGIVYFSRRNSGHLNPARGYLGAAAAIYEALAAEGDNGELKKKVNDYWALLQKAAERTGNTGIES